MNNDNIACSDRGRWATMLWCLPCEEHVALGATVVQTPSRHVSSGPHTTEEGITHGPTAWHHHSVYQQSVIHLKCNACLEAKNASTNQGLHDAK